ncbi:MAG TPA: efflux RND transporter periplasmic adaptor subunit [Spirochaetia bacterium]|nr:efflux RND transporter periplasmic adaptor subunit [Spirochaetia bacterium]HRZ63364.1 efflux RND transporter periplasmic adaptor subunit [Spirochaetia bacterium]
MRTKKAAAIAVALIIVGGLALLALRRGGAPAKAEARGPAAAAPAASEAKPVKVAAAAVGTLRPYIDASGDVEAVVNVDVFPDIGGKVVEYKVALGDRVEKGQAIALVDPSKPGSAYALSAVGSPISGTVTSILAQQGETVASSSSSLAKVGQVDQLKVVVKLAERDSAKAAVGMSAQVSFEALPGESFAATVSRVSPVLDASSRTREIWLAFSAKDRRMSAGMYAKVRLYTDPVSGSLVIPAEAVTLRDGEPFVYVAASRGGERIAEKRAVKTGTAVDGKLAVLSGLAEGDSVVYEGQGNVSDGALVTVVGEAAR